MNPRSFSFLSIALSGFLVTGCAVGPDFAAPERPDVSSYDYSPTAKVTSDKAQTLEEGRDIPAEWWRLFHSDGLSHLVADAIRDNPDMAAAEATLRVTQDNLAAEGAELFPTVSGGYSYTRQKTSAAAEDNFAPSFIYSLHNASVSVSYALDIWGGTRRAIEQAQAQSNEANFEREATYLTLTSNVVTAAIQEASIREQIEATESIISEQEKVLKILQARFDAGAAAKSSLAEQQATVAAARANLPPLDHALVVERHLLSMLIGQMPQNEPSATFRLKDLTLPAQIPLSVPANLIEERPDVREAEENLHAASAAIGIAEAARLPQITLTGDIGSEATQFGKLFTPGSGMWDFGGSLAQTIFDAGALADKEQAARDNYLAAAAQYKKAVLTAFQNVADTLHALQSDSDALKAKADADAAASESLSLAQSQLKAGAITPVEVLTAENTEQQTKLALVQARAQRYADTAALFVALGGGWWNRDKNGLIIGSDVIISPDLLKGTSHD